MSNILILMMSSNTAPIFKNEVDAAYETWASSLPQNIDVMYYDGGHKDIKNTELDGNYIKCISNDTLQYTFPKTIEAIQYVLSMNKYDYILRTNTSTYINVKLLEELDKSGFFDDKHIYGTDLYSLTEAACPFPLDIYCRGNCIMMPVSLWKKTISNSIQLLYQGIVDDVCIGNAFNSMSGNGYLEYIKGLPHAWYKCTVSKSENNHKISTYYGLDDINDYGQCLTIQIKMYRQRGNEIENLREFHDKFKDVNPDVQRAVSYSENPSIFIGSILGYISLDAWKKTPKKALYEFEMKHKAIDDKQNPRFSKCAYNKLHSLQ